MSPFIRVVAAGSLRVTISLAFLIYALIVSRIRLYSTSGRNASTNAANDEQIELAGVPASKWYARVPNAEVDADNHVIGDDE